MNLLRYLYLGCCAALDIMLLLFGFAGVAAFIEEPDPSVPLGMVFAFILCAVIMLGITIASFRKVRKGEKFPILPGFFLKIATIILTLGIIWFILEIPEAGWLAVVVAILIGVLIILLPKLLKVQNPPAAQNPAAAAQNSAAAAQNSAAATQKAPPAIELPAFKSDKAEWAWEDAALEYLRLKGQNIDNSTEDGQKVLAARVAEMSEEESDKLFDYAGTPIAYFLGWLIQRGLISIDFETAHPQEIQGVLEEKITPSEILRNMDYVLTKEDVRPEAHQFMNLYYNTEINRSSYNHNTHKYFFDYYKVICSGYGVPRYYCIDFDWERFHELSAVLNRRYHSFTASVIDEEEMEDGEQRLTTRYFGRGAELLYEPGTPLEYVKLCADDFESMGKHLCRDICEHLIEFCPEELAEDNMEPERVIRHFEPSRVVVMNPVGNCILEAGNGGGLSVPEGSGSAAAGSGGSAAANGGASSMDGGGLPVPAYVILGGSDWEEEHGLAFTVIGDFAVNCSYYADAVSPWEDDMQWIYMVRRDAQLGEELPVNVIPVQFGGTNALDNRVLVPAAAVQRKAEVDTMVEALYMLKLADKYDCKVTYHKGRPNYLFVSAMKGEIRTFADSIRVR